MTGREVKNDDARFWHLADNPTAPAFVRYWTKADKAGFWREMVCPLLTHKRHGVDVRSSSGTPRDIEKQFFSIMILKCRKPQKGASCCRRLRNHSGRPYCCIWECMLALGAAPTNLPSGPTTALASHAC